MTWTSTKAWVKKYVWTIVIVIVLIIAIVAVVWWKFCSDPSERQTKTKPGSASGAVEPAPSPDKEAQAFWSDTSATNTDKKVTDADGVVTHLVKLENGGGRAMIHGKVIEPDWVEGPYEGIIIPTHTIGGRVGVHPSSTADEPPVGVEIPTQYRLRYKWEQITESTKRLLGQHEGAYSLVPGQIWVLRSSLENKKPKLPDWKEVKPKK